MTQQHTGTRGTTGTWRARLTATALGLALTSGAGASLAGSADADRTVEETLYGLDGTIDGTRIGWHVNDVLTAYEEAIQRQQPLVVVFAAEWCEWCWTMVDEALTCPSLNRLAGHAVFAFSSTIDDETAAILVDRLGIEGYPTITILAPDAAVIAEEARISGFFPGDTLAALIADTLTEAGYAATPIDGPAAPSLFTPLAQTPVDPTACAG